MPEKISRRRMLHKGGAILVGGAGVCASSALQAGEPHPSLASVKVVDYYQKLGVNPLINAAGTYTMLSASTMPDEVQAAVALAAAVFARVDMREHHGIHPRIGALDVLPFVPLRDFAMDDAVAVA